MSGVTVERARAEYWLASYRLALLADEDKSLLPHLHDVALWVEAKALALDMACAAESDARLRASVAY